MFLSGQEPSGSGRFLALQILFSVVFHFQPFFEFIVLKDPNGSREGLRIIKDEVIFVSDLGGKIFCLFKCFRTIFCAPQFSKIFILEVHILNLKSIFVTRCVGIVVRILGCHQRDPSSNPSTTKPFCKKLSLENSLKND